MGATTKEVKEEGQSSIRGIFERVSEIQRSIRKETKESLVEVVNSEINWAYQDGLFRTEMGTMSPDIEHYFSALGIRLLDERLNETEFFNITYPSLNREVIENAKNGAKKAQGNIAEIQKRLTGLENFYLLAGIWKASYNNGKMQDSYCESKTIVEMVCDLIEKSIGNNQPYAGYPSADLIREKIKRARKKVTDEYEAFTCSIGTLLQEAIPLRKKKENEPLFFPSREEERYMELKNKIYLIVAKCQFAPEFVYRYEKLHPNVITPLVYNNLLSQLSKLT
jgi:hypothetical protein